MIEKEAKERAREKAGQIVSQMTLREMMSQLLHNSPAIKRLGIPEYNWWNEGLHGAARSGTATVFPQAIALAATFSTTLLHEVGEIVSDEQRAKYEAFSSKGDRGIYKGLTIWSPNVNIFRDPRWGRGQETYGEDPYLTSSLAVSFIKGIQGDDGSHLKCAATVKHFAAHSGPEAERHHFNSVVSEKDLEETYLPAFKAAVQKAGVDGVMGAYSMLNGEPSCATGLIDSLLRKKWGFDGIFVSDCWAIRDFHEQHHYTSKPEESAALAVKRGCDLNCGCTYSYLEKAYSKGLISREEIKRAAVRLFTTRVLLGEFGDNIYSVPYSAVASPEHYRASLEASRRSVVLLSNDGFLPLSPDSISSIAVIGPNADSRAVLWGNYHGTSASYTTVLEGVKNVLGESVRVYFSEGSGLVKDHVERLGENDDRLSEAASAAELADVVLLCLGLDETVEGEMHDDGNGGIAGDRNDVRLPRPQRKLLERVAESGKPIVLVLFSGGGIDPEIKHMENVRAVIQGWYPGEAGGQAIAEIIFGLVNPSGKLPITFYRSADTLPDYADYSLKGRTYRYMTERPLYPFAHGLSYTSYSYRSICYDEKANEARLIVANTGSMDGEEVSFVWCSIDSDDAPPNPRLCGFARTAIASGEEREVRIRLDDDVFTLVDKSGSRYRKSGVWKLSCGGSQCDVYSLSLSGSNVLYLEVEI